MSTSLDATTGSPRAARRTRKSGRVAALAALVTPLLLAATACGGSEPDASAGGDRELSGEPVIEATFDISGDVTVKATVTDVVPANKDGSRPQTCQEYARGFKLSDRTILDLPRFLGANDVGGHSVLLDGRISHYNGPGTYPRSELSGSGNPIGFSIDSHALVAEESTNASVTVNADGSGSFTFDTLSETSTGITNPQSITGKLTWTCKNA